MIVLSIMIGLILIACGRISKWKRIATGKQKIYDGSTQQEAILEWIGLVFVFLPIILSIILK